MPSFDHFEIDIISALSSQLVSAFDNLVAGVMTEDVLGALPVGQGVYQLYHQGALVYVGKSDKLARRLSEHRKKISGRRNILVSETAFKCLYVHPNWTALAPEESLIRHYRQTGTGECTWNGNGFGPHDPGRERETTNKPSEGFDVQYPIQEDWPCEWIAAGQHNGKELLRSFKSGLPFLLRYQRETRSLTAGHPDYNSRTIVIRESGMSARELLKTITEQLPGWQATIFPGHMILYQEDRAYTHGRTVWPERD